MDELRLLQQRENKTRSDSGQDSVQEEFGSTDKTVLEVVARETTQLLERRSVHISRVRSGSVHNIGALVVVEEVQPHSFPADQLQARHQDIDVGVGEVERSVFGQIAFEPVPKVRACVS